VRWESAANGTDLVGTAVLPEADDKPLRAGMLGRARVEIVRTTVAGALAQTARRIIRLDFML
jgi:hypothetical protein